MPVYVESGAAAYHRARGTAMRGCFGATMAVSMMLSPLADAAEKALPKWELGLGGGAVSLPQYMGSDERYTLAVPVPYVVYRGDRFKVDRDGIRAELFGLKQLTLDASFGAGLPVRNSNRARAGMPELKFNFQAGPRLNWQIYDSELSDLKLRLPWRGIIDTSGTTPGWLLEPDLQYRLRPTSQLSLRLNAGILYASRGFNNTYYGVAPQFVTPARAAYTARAGLHSLAAGATVRYAITDDVTLYGALRYRNLKAGVVSNSPLVRSQNYLAIAVGMTWSIWQSDEAATTEEHE
ncbi:MipA/OmpV family protein [Mariprofundus erugo]|uniref:MipA/OmpV family protein n=1 Tax=Mariprofundus erugo TaxID=2528639 RepID=UPI001EE7EC0C|nr:MipA/OmpV family protein [Mariprofundus erugo]